MQRVRLSTADSESHGNTYDNTLGEVEDGFVIRGVHKAELLGREPQLRGQSFNGGSAPVYRPRPRPHHLAKESTETKQAESRRWTGAYGQNRFKVAAQLARLAAHSKLAGQRGVGAAVANQIVAKKWKEVGNFLKGTAGGITRIQSLVDRDKQGYMSAAQEAIRLAAVGVLDVKLTVRSDHELQHLSYLHQGDASLYTPEMLAARLAIKSTPAFREAVVAWWQWLPLCTLPPEERLTDDEKLMPPDMRGMTKPVYCAMAAILQRVLLPRFGLKPSPSYEPEEDWVFDCHGRRFLLFPQLLNALFELADMWTPTVCETDYVAILLELLEQCKALEGRHGLFSKLLQKYQRRYGALAEHHLPISGGYVVDFDTTAGRAVLASMGQTGAGGVAAASAAAGGGGGAGAASAGEGQGAAGGAAAGEEAASAADGVEKGSGDEGAAAAEAPTDDGGDTAAAAADFVVGALRGADEADLVLKALSDDDNDEDHRAATNWWAKIMERNRKFMEAKASGLADAVAEAAAAAACRTTSSSGSRPVSPLQFPMALLGSLYDSPHGTESGAAGGGGGPPAGAGGKKAPQPPQQPKGPTGMRLGKGLKGQAAPMPSTEVVATLRDAVTDALVEVGASTDAADAARVLTEDGTIAYQQVGPHTLAELLQVLVDYKRMNTRHIRALIGTSNKALLGPRAGPSSKSLLGAGMGLAAGPSNKSLLGSGMETGLAAGPSNKSLLAQSLGAPAAAGDAGGEGLQSRSTTTSRRRITLPTTPSPPPPVDAAAATSPSGAVGTAGAEPTAAAATPSAASVAGSAISPRGAASTGDGSTLAEACGAAAAAGSSGDEVPGDDGSVGPDGGGARASSPGAGQVVSGDAEEGGGAGAAKGAAVAAAAATENDKGQHEDEVEEAEEDGDNRPGPPVFAARPRTPTLDPATLCAIRATLQGAGLDAGELSGMLASHGLGLAMDVQPQALVQVAKVLAPAGFDTEAIVAFLFPPEDAEGASAAFSLTEPLSEVQLQAMRVALCKAGVTDEMVELVRSWTADVRTIQATSSALEASGFTPLEVQRFIAPAASTALIDALQRRGITAASAAALMRRDGTGLSLELSPMELAEAADAMAAAGFTAAQVVRAIGSDAAFVPPLEPAGLDACREALLSEGGFTEEELEEVVLADNGTALQDGIGAATMARVVGALAKGGLSTETIRRFLRYDIVRAAKARLTRPALRAMQSVITGAGLMEGAPTDVAPLLPDGTGVAPDAGAGMVAQIGGALVEAMFQPAQIRAFLMPEDGTAPEDPTSTTASRTTTIDGATTTTTTTDATSTSLTTQPPTATDAPSASQAADSSPSSSSAPTSAPPPPPPPPPRPRRHFLSPREVVVFRSVLMASGFSTQDLMDLVRGDGRGLDPDSDPELAAKAVAAMSAAGFRGHEIQLFLQLRDPAPAMTPAEAAAARAALVTGGFGPPQLEDMLRRDGLGLLFDPEPEPYVMAQVAVVMTGAGFPTFHICQYLSPALPLVPVRMLAVGRYFGHGVSGRLSRPVSQGPSAKPWAMMVEEGRLFDDVSEDEEDQRAEDEAAAATEAARQQRRTAEQAERGQGDGDGPAADQDADEEAGTEAPTQGSSGGGVAAGDTDVDLAPSADPSSAAVAAPEELEGPTAHHLVLPPEVLGVMRETVSRRCKGLNAKQMRQLAPRLADPPAGAGSGAASGGGGGGGGSSGMWLPLDGDVTARVVRALSYEGFSPNDIRRFFLQPALAAVGGAGAGGTPASGGASSSSGGVAAGCGGNGGAAGSGAGELFDHITPPLLFLARALLKASGFTDQHLSNMMSADRHRLDPDWDSESAAMMVAALARAGCGAGLMRLMLTTGPPVPALTPNELGAINEALLEAGFSRRQLRLVLRPDHSGPGRSIDPTTLAQMATALSQAGCSAGHLCQFLGPPPASFSKPVPLPLLSPLLAAINGPPAANTTITGIVNLIAAGASALSASGTGALVVSAGPTLQPPPPLPGLASTTSLIAPAPGVNMGPSPATPPTLTPSISTPLACFASGSIPQSNPAGASSLPLSSSGPQPLSPGAAATAAAAAAPVTSSNLAGATASSSCALDSRSVMDIRNVAASCGISSRTLAEMIRPDGRGLQPHADPRVIERVGLHMVNQGFTPAQVYRFLLPHGGCEYGRLDPPTSAAVRAVLLAAGYSPADLKALLSANNTTLAPSTPSATLAAVAYSLAASGATADQIRHFLRPTPLSPTPPPAANAAAAGTTNAGTGATGTGASNPNSTSAAAAAATATAPTIMSPTAIAEVILGGLMASGYEDHQLDLILRRDGTALRADVGPLRLAQMVAALAAADVPAAAIRIFVRPLGGLNPTVTAALKAALERFPGFDRERVEAAFSPEAYELGPAVEPSTLAAIATALSASGVAPDVIRQLISLPPGMAPAAPSPSPPPPPPATSSDQSPLPTPLPPSPALQPTLPALSSSGPTPAVPPPTAPSAEASATAAATGTGGVQQVHVGPMLRGRGTGALAGAAVSSGVGSGLVGGLHPSLPFTRMLAMREAIASRSDPANPGELLDLHDPAKVVVMLAELGYPSADIRAFISSDPKVIAGASARGSVATGAGSAGPSGGNGFVSAVLARSGALGPPLRMSDPGLTRSNTKLRTNMTIQDRARLPALAWSPASGPAPRATVDGSMSAPLDLPTRPTGPLPRSETSSPIRQGPRPAQPTMGSIGEEPMRPPTPPQQPPPPPPVPAWPDFEYRLPGSYGDNGTADGAEGGPGRPPLVPSDVLLAWTSGVWQPDGYSERLPPGLERQLATYLRKVLIRLVGNDTLRAATGVGLAAGAAEVAAGAASNGSLDGAAAAAAAAGATSGLQAAAAAAAAAAAGSGAKPSKSRTLIKVLEASVSQLLTRIRGLASASGQAWAVPVGDGDSSGAGGGGYGGSGGTSLQVQTLSLVLSALLHRPPGASSSGSGANATTSISTNSSGGGAGGGLPPDGAAPTLLRFLVVQASRQGLLQDPEVLPPGPSPRPPPMGPEPSAAPSSLTTSSHLTSQAPDAASPSRKPELGNLRPLPPGYARAWGEAPMARRAMGGPHQHQQLLHPGSPGGNSLLNGRFGGSSGGYYSPTAPGPPPLLYRPMPPRVNPSPTAAKAGSPRETLPPWPLQRVFVHPTSVSQVLATSTSASPTGPGAGPGLGGWRSGPSRLAVEIPDNPAELVSPNSPVVAAGGGGGGGGGVSAGTAHRRSANGHQLHPYPHHHLQPASHLHASPRTSTQHAHPHPHPHPPHPPHHPNLQQQPQQQHPAPLQSPGYTDIGGGSGDRISNSGSGIVLPPAGRVPGGSRPNSRPPSPGEGVLATGAGGGGGGGVWALPAAAASPLGPRRPSSSGALQGGQVGGGGGVASDGGGGGGGGLAAEQSGEGEPAVKMLLPVLLSRSASLSRISTDNPAASSDAQSTNLRRSLPAVNMGGAPVPAAAGGAGGDPGSGAAPWGTVAAAPGSPAGGPGRLGDGGVPSPAAAPWGVPVSGPMGPEALFTRLLAEVLRWLEAPADVPEGSPAAWSRRLAPWAWSAWLAAQKARLASQMAALGAPQQPRQSQLPPPPLPSSSLGGLALPAEALRRTSDPGATFLLTQQTSDFGPWAGS